MPDQPLGERLIAYVQMTEEQAARKARERKAILSQINSIEQFATMLDVCDAIYARGQKERAQLAKLLDDLQKGPNTLVPIKRVLSGQNALVVSHRGEYDRVSILTGENGEPVIQDPFVGQAVWLDPSSALAIEADANVFECEEEGIILGLDDTGTRAKVDWGAKSGGTKWVTLAQPLVAINGKLGRGTRILGSSRHGLAAALAPKIDEESHAKGRVQRALRFGGCHKVRRQVEQYVIEPLSRPKDFLDRDKMGFPIFIICQGVTGLGKTYSMQWAAQQIPDCLLLERAPHHYRQPVFGSSEGAVKADGYYVAEMAQERPVLWVINEGDVIATSRTQHEFSSVRSTLQAITSALLNVIDDLRYHYPTAPVVLAITTNLPAEIDFALRNDHRLTATLKYEYLQPDEVHEVLEVHFERLELDDHQEACLRAADRLTDRSCPLVECKVDGEDHHVFLPDMLSPALIYGVAQTANMKATHDADNGKRKVRWEHINAAIDERVMALGDRLRENRGNLDEMLPDLQGKRVTDITVVWQEHAAEAALA